MLRRGPWAPEYAKRRPTPNLLVYAKPRGAVSGVASLVFWSDGGPPRGPSRAAERAGARESR
eukprot:1117949-Pyramimonas_sp.AAC.1